jgi:hypothetical protein
MKTFARFSLDPPDFESLRRTSQAIIKRERPLLVDSRSVGHCLRQFVERCISIPIPHNCETCFLYDLGDELSPGMLAPLRVAPLHSAEYLAHFPRPHPDLATFSSQ